MQCNAMVLSSTPHNTMSTKKRKLRRLPHVFSRVLELPFPANADVSVQEAPHYFRFVAEAPAATQVEAHIVQIHPGLTKVLVKETTTAASFDLHLDVWRIRLPESTCLELSTAVIVAGELVVTVPKTDTILLLH